MYKITARVSLEFDCEIKASEEFLFHWAGESTPCLENFQYALNESEKWFDETEQELILENIDSLGFGPINLPAELSSESATNLQIRPVKD